MKKTLKNKKREKEIKKFFSENYPNLFKYFSDLEVQKGLKFSDYDCLLPFKH